jgi:alkylation response protein AidB-like acyl-CoA dehydrogenase
MNGGHLPAAALQQIREEALKRKLRGGLHAAEHGGNSWTHVEWFLVEEQLGRITNAVSWHMPTAYNVLAHGSPEQIEKYLLPGLRGETHDAYAVTEEHAGSDPSGITTTAVKDGDGWTISGEKWFVTYGDVAAVFIVMANAIVDGEPQGTLFLIDADTDGIEVVDNPPFTHTYPHGHPTIRFNDVKVGDDAIIGVYVIKAMTADTWELMNIAVAPEHQGQGIGALLLRHAIDQARQLGAQRLELGTGCFGHQLTFDQRAGFRVVAVEPDYFPQHYPEPLFENGLQHRDRLRLALVL